MNIVIGPRDRTTLGAAEIWRYRELFYFFTWRDVKIKYRQASLGLAWAVIQPLLLTAVFSVFFGTRMRTELTTPYPLFAFSGLLVWNLFAGGLNSSANSMVGNAHIIRKVYFPRLVIPVSSVLVSLFDTLVALPVLFLLIVWYGTTLRLAAPAFVLAGLVLAVAGTIGAGCGLAALAVKYRDFKYVVPFLVQFLLFVTPVIYPLSYVRTPLLRHLLAVNPIAGAVEIVRGCSAAWTVDWRVVSVSGVSALLLLVVGVWYFRWTEAYFADIA